MEHLLFMRETAWLDSPGKDWMNHFSAASWADRAASGLLMLFEAPRRAVSVLELSNSASSSLECPRFKAHGLVNNLITAKFLGILGKAQSSDIYT